MPWKIALIGTGNLGYLWANYLKDLPHIELRALASTPQKSQAFCEQFDLRVYDPSESWTPDFILLCLKDDQIHSFLSEFSGNTPIFLHGGSLSLSDFGQQNLGIIYPLQSIHKEIESDIKSIPFLCEFNPSVANLGKNVMESLSLNYQEVTVKQRHAAHLCAVFINNFGYFVMNEGLEQAKAHQLSVELFKPLIHKTVNNILLNKDLQTGPARRGDQKVIQKHMASLSGSQKALYQWLTEAIQKKYNHEL